jgi:hypothetical protein
MLETVLAALRRALGTMAKSEQPGSSSAIAPDLLTHLEQVFGWSRVQAEDELRAYIMSTEAGQALRRELASHHRADRAA